MRALVLVFTFSLFGGSAIASDGVVEINQTCADSIDGCFCGDAQFFPVTINGCAGRSYRLTGDLRIGSPVQTGIIVSAPDVSLDLGGFAIKGLNVCNGSPSGCAYNGTGNGIEVTAGSEGEADRLSISNGSIIGLGGKAIFLGSGEAHAINRVRVAHSGREGIHSLGDGTIVNDVISSRNGLSGIALDGAGGRVTDSQVHENGRSGVLAGQGTVVARITSRSNAVYGIVVAEASTVTASTVTANGSNGVSALLSSTVSECSIRGNGGFGIHMELQGFDGSHGGSIRKNVVTSNSSGIVTGTGVLVEENSISKNLSGGLVLNSGSAYRANLITENANVPVSGVSFINLGGNGCTNAANTIVPCP